MSDKELKDYQAKLEKFTQKVTKTESASKKFLVEKGVITPSGKITQRYKGVLCTPQGRV